MSQFESLRQHALAGKPADLPGSQGLGVAFLERQGLAAWVETPVEKVVPGDGRHPLGPKAAQPADDLVQALVALLLGDRKEVQDG